MEGVDDLGEADGGGGTGDLVGEAGGAEVSPGFGAALGACVDFVEEPDADDAGAGLATGGSSLAGGGVGVCRDVGFAGDADLKHHRHGERIPVQVLPVAESSHGWLGGAVACNTAPSGGELGHVPRLRRGLILCVGSRAYQEQGGGKRGNQKNAATHGCLN
ncbi:MAG: hypothetical protein BWY79_01965 [Actinobacteria bacterium ADurb.Bin444]|nr:MAG: hypothetical protein BWY79_01965 [Actinobacteria bacterium ADurb.Bin444]